MKQIIAIITIATAATLAGKAQTNAITAVKPNPWQSTVAAGLTLTRGNSDDLLFTAKIGTEKKQDSNEYILGADAAYGKNNGIENQDSLHGEAQYNHLFTEKFYGYVNLDGLHDGIQDLNYRVSLNPGVGYYFIKTKPTTFAGEFGPGVVTEDRGDHKTTYMSVRVSEHFEQQITESAKFFEKAELVPQVDKPANYVVNAEVGIETAISKSLSLQVTLDDAYVNEPAVGRKKNDIKLISAVVYKF